MIHEMATLRCPCCHRPTLACRVEGDSAQVEVSLISQGCLCDPFADWDDVFEQAREYLRD